MMKLLQLTGIVILKVLITKSIAFVCILLSFLLKSKQFYKSSHKWNEYFLSLDDTFVDLYMKIIYMISTIVSSCIMFLLFKLFHFQSPIFLTLIILTVCSLITWYRYQKNGKSYIKSRFYEVKEAIKFDSVSNDSTS